MPSKNWVSIWYVVCITLAANNIQIYTLIYLCKTYEMFQLTHTGKLFIHSFRNTKISLSKLFFSGKGNNPAQLSARLHTNLSMLKWTIFTSDLYLSYTTEPKYD